MEQASLVGAARRFLWQRTSFQLIAGSPCVIGFYCCQNRLLLLLSLLLGVEAAQPGAFLRRLIVVSHELFQLRLDELLQQVLDLGVVSRGWQCCLYDGLDITTRARFVKT